jgi:hypothetical protein
MSQQRTPWSRPAIVAWGCLVAAMVAFIGIVGGLIQAAILAAFGIIALVWEVGDDPLHAKRHL